MSLLMENINKILYFIYSKIKLENIIRGIVCCINYESAHESK